MPSRKHIEPNRSGFRRLSYTCRAGWIDWNHASSMARPLRAQVVDRTRSEPFNVTFEGRPATAVEYSMSQGGSLVGQVSRVTNQYVFLDELSYPEREAAALGMFLHTSVGFERMQGSFPWAVIPRSNASSFSGEDLMSNVVGFFAVMRGYTQERMRVELGELSVDESYAIWDAQFGRDGDFGVTNTTLQPVRYTGAPCRDTALPGMFNSIVPAENGTSWVALRTRLTHHYANTQVPVDVAADGTVRNVPPGAARRLAIDGAFRSMPSW